VSGQSALCCVVSVHKIPIFLMQMQSIEDELKGELPSDRIVNWPKKAIDRKIIKRSIKWSIQKMDKSIELTKFFPLFNKSGAVHHFCWPARQFTVHYAEILFFLYFLILTNIMGGYGYDRLIKMCVCAPHLAEYIYWSTILPIYFLLAIRSLILLIHKHMCFFVVAYPLIGMLTLVVIG
jgi:hypothetical protein